MTKSTDTKHNDLSNQLLRIYNKYQPLLIKRKRDINENIEDFLNLFLQEKSGIESIKILMPAFYKVKEIINWDIKRFDYLKFYSSINSTNFIPYFSNQSYLSKKFNHRFSVTILDVLNKKGNEKVPMLNGSLVVHISSTNENIHSVHKYPDYERLHFKISKSFTEKLKKEIPVEFSEFIDENGHKETIHEINVSLDDNILSSIQALIDIQEQPFEINEEYKGIKFTELFPSVLLHSLYTTEDLDLLYFFSNTAYNEFNYNDVGLGGIFTIIEKNSINDNTLFLLQALNDKLATRIVNHYHLDQLHVQSTKAAIAAIMSRNMSHNLGSHVLYYIKSKLIHAPNRFRKLLHELEKNTDGSYQLKLLEDWFKNKKVDVNLVKQKEIKAPFLLGLGKFIGYVQERQDFIATIASDFIPYFDSVNFKDFVYDVLLPDLKQKRHSHDSHAEYETKNLFLDYIAKTEGYNSSSIKIYFGKFNGTDLSTNDAKNDFERLKKIQIDMPGGIMGRQAFFSIMENIIRNTAKHNERINGDLYFNINFTPSKKFSDFHEVVISDNVTSYDEVSEIIGDALKEDYVNDKGELIKTNKGIKEIRISAAWLRGYNVAEIDEQNMGVNEPKLIQLKNINGYLGYKFYLPKTKVGIFIIEEEDLTKEVKDLTKEEKEELKKIECLTLEEYRKKHNKNYDIVLYDVASYKEKQVVEIKNMSIPRVSAVSFKDIKELLENKKNVFKEYYFKWVDNIIRANKANNYVDIVESEKESNYINENIDNNYLKYNNGLADVNIFGKAPIVFNTHNDNANVFHDFRVKEPNLYNSVTFIEGISGHNSTVRMIRDYENKDKLWAYKMIESALTKVLIIDERLFDTNGGNINKNISKEIFSKDDFKGFTTVNEYRSVIISKGTEFRIGNIEERVNRIIRYNKDYNSEDVEFLIQELNNKGEEQTNYIMDILDKKRITLYNIVKSENKAIIYDLNTESQFEIIPTRDDKNEEKMKNCMMKNYKTNEIEIYDFVVIHESLLGKLYNMCNATNPNKKEEVFASFKNIFPAKYRYIIHSGRSKPDFLPQETVFNQFSTIENALADCKYTLTELLFSSRIEN